MSPAHVGAEKSIKNAVINKAAYHLAQTFFQKL